MLNGLKGYVGQRTPVVLVALENLWHYSQGSGGLGALMWDMLLALFRRNTPAVLLGLFYRQGYFVQYFDGDGWQQARYDNFVPEKLGLKLVKRGRRALVVGIPLADGRTLHAQIWERREGSVRQLLLDSNVEQNDDELKKVSARLYGGGDWERLLQELLLGVGGQMVIAELGLCPPVYHLQEGHAWAIILERLRQYRLAGWSNEDARRMVWATTIFTSHTPVPAGIDRIPGSLMRKALSPDYLAQAGFSFAELMHSGRDERYDVFNVAHFLLRLCKRVTAVAKLHRDVSEQLFAAVTDRSAFDFVTNGVGEQWVAPSILKLYQRGLANVAPATLWATRRALRVALVRYVRQRLTPPGGQTPDILNEDYLTIGFARRVPTYKRLTEMIGDSEEDWRHGAMIHLLENAPVQFIWAGKAHPHDEDGAELLQRMQGFIAYLKAEKPELAKRFIFVDDYDVALAAHMVQGCDIWLNNPELFKEACGTSWAKAAENGGVMVSVKDGGVPEFLIDGVNGFSLGGDTPAKPGEIAAEFYRLIWSRILPAFTTLIGGVPLAWLSLVANAINLRPQLDSDRMMAEYEELYVAAAADGEWAWGLRQPDEALAG